MSKYNKPFIVIYRQFLPKAGVDTRQKGWIAEGLESVERFEIVDRLSNRQKRDGMVIIDLLDMKIVQNGSGLDRDVILAHYSNKYANDIAHGVEVWLALKAKDAAEAADEG